jgi:streptogramin lyase
VPARCGNQRPDIAGISGADGLAIGGEGTIYFTQQPAGPDGWVGRLQPGAAPEPRWARIPGSAQSLWGLATDGRRQRLYVASASNQAIFWLDLSVDPPSLHQLVTGLSAPNDVAVDRAGNVYFSSRGDKHVHRVAPAGVASVVTRSPIPGQYSPAGLAFGPAGELFVGSASGPLLRIDLTDGIETQRVAHGDYTGWANGIAVDARGRLYVGGYGQSGNQPGFVRIDGSDAQPVSLQPGARFSSMAFGRGALDCRDLYLAVSNGELRRIQTDTPGLPVP